MSHRHNHKTTPPGSPRDVLARLTKLRANVRQLIVDVESYNDNSRLGRLCPLDTGADRVLLRLIDQAIAKVKHDGQTAGIMDPIIDHLNRTTPTRKDPPP